VPVETIRWENEELSIVDQTLLPERFEYITLNTVQDVWDAIKALKVRGAPAIGVCAALGLIVGIREKKPAASAEAITAAHESARFLATSRPTAVNLFWALDRMTRVADALPQDTSVDAIIDRLEEEAVAILDEDRRVCRAIGGYGAALIKENTGVLTHCNAGGLATADYGTALGVLFRAHEEGRHFHVYADETRPLLQGARLTAWELKKAEIDVTLICDSMAAQVMKEGKIQMVIVGADRIAANGDAANKIGTYSLAVLAHAHSIPFYVAAPLSTFDSALPDGEAIPIEQRDPAAITHGFGLRTAPEGVDVYSPAFDVTPAHLIAGIVTEEGVLHAPNKESIARCLELAQQDAIDV
jgi:methylthioribose-1-phosphate isomerase